MKYWYHFVREVLEFSSNTKSGYNCRKTVAVVVVVYGPCNNAPLVIEQ